MEVLTKVTAHLLEIFHVYVHLCCMKCYMGNERSSIASAPKDLKMLLVRQLPHQKLWERCEGQHIFLLLLNNFFGLVTVTEFSDIAFHSSHYIVFPWLVSVYTKAPSKLIKFPLKPHKISPVDVYCPQDVSYVRLVLIDLPLLNLGPCFPPAL